MATTTAKGAIADKPSGSTNNNGATVAYGGNINSDSKTVTQALAFTVLNKRTSYGSLVTQPETNDTMTAGTDTAATYQPLSAGTFAYFLKGHYVMQGGNVTTTLAGVARTALAFGAGDSGARKSINKTEQDRTLVQRTWDWTTGAASSNIVTVNYAGVSGVTDHAARPTRGVPGELVILEGQKVPTYKDYSEKTD